MIQNYMLPGHRSTSLNIVLIQITIAGWKINSSFYDLQELLHYYMKS